MYSVKEYKFSMDIALEEVQLAQKAEVPLDRVFIEKTSIKLYDAWMAHNQKDPDAPEKMYFELTESEKENKRFFVREAIKLLQ